LAQPTAAIEEAGLGVGAARACTDGGHRMLRAGGGAAVPDVQAA
jgi:hypothetical protein